MILALKWYQEQAKWVKEDFAHLYLRWTEWFCHLTWGIKRLLQAVGDR